MSPPDRASHGEKSSSITSMLTRVIARSPTAINERRQMLLPRTSVDVESQASSSGSTLLEERLDDDDDNDEHEWNEKGRPSPILAIQGHQPPQRIDPRIISDAIIGLSDGLTVPFALTAGLSALGNTRMVIFAGLAELTAGAISMGLGGYLGAKSEEQSHLATLSETQTLTSANLHATSQQISDLLTSYSLPSSLHDALTTHLASSPSLATDFLMRMSHQSASGSELVSSSRAVTCAMTIAAGYFLGGFVPLVPYFVVDSSREKAVQIALAWSVGVMIVSLFVFGYAKTCFVSGWRGKEKVWEGTVGGGQMVIVGGLAAGCAMGLVRLFDSLATV